MWAWSYLEVLFRSFSLESAKMEAYALPKYSSTASTQRIDLFNRV